jgi:hypothetical protein
MLKGPGVGLGVGPAGKDGHVKGVPVGSGVAESVAVGVSVGAGATAIVDGIAAGPWAAAVPTATQAADASTTHKAA